MITLNEPSRSCTYVDEADVREFLALNQSTRVALPQAFAIIQEVFGSITPMLIVAHDPDGMQYDQLMVLVPVRGDIDPALHQLSLVRRAWFANPFAFDSKLSIDVEVI